ncbi:MAG: hypothetical protein ACRD2N_15455 [Vicinamibacterales bacterium]
MSEGDASRVETTFGAVCAGLETALDGSARAQIVGEAAEAATDLASALDRMRESMRTNVWKVASPVIDLERSIKRYDKRTRGDGFHALHDWDGIADKVNPETIPVDVLDYLRRERGSEAVTPIVLAVLLDYYFMHILSLVALRVWDEGDADRNLDRVDRLLGRLQGPHGSGQRFAADAETLILIATSHFELAEWGYGKLLERARTLNLEHRRRMAMGHSASIGSHLRFGFEATYGRDTLKTRDDNVADYPWLCFALCTLMREYVRMQDEGVEERERRPLVEALLNGLTPDARAFVGTRPPASLSEVELERAEVRELFHAHRDALLQQFEGLRPSEQRYSPLSFFFNFSHNVVKGAVVDALFRGRPWGLTLNDLLNSEPREETPEASREALATTLMGHARRNPNRIRGRLMPVIVYDPHAGKLAFSVAMAKLRE